MSRPDTLLRTKLAPPGLHRRLLPRPALTEKLRESVDVRLTLVQAGTGYGKSTALAALAEAEPSARLAWCSLDAADADPQRFLAYLIAALRACLPGLSESPSAVLQEVTSAGSAGAWTAVVDALINALAGALDAALLLVIDDYDFVAAAPEANALAERFIT